ncbi:polyketide cyclase [Lottiidibacillus patelloidae]|uniref:Polyketide cyclase n=1 Tax=Lottiidibacillus patelloidae TaxID=2670334 RepID=A0A263BWA0_9BACI|nr:nuclear transport factor 2 family protein [Lottiidibacillus patelloidae]OZM58021.1 polyketide cyclase [Lottiidibacillus patelloidae]
MNIESNISMKEEAIAFLKLVVAGNIRDAFKRYTSADLCHHNPYFHGDAESLIVAMEENHVDAPNKIFEVKLALQEGDRVVVYSHVKQNADDIGAAIVHIFRFENDEIVEMWDVGQQIPENSPNENGMF